MEHSHLLAVIPREDGRFDLEVLTYAPCGYRLVPGLSAAETLAWIGRPGTVLFFGPGSRDVLDG